MYTNSLKWYIIQMEFIVCPSVPHSHHLLPIGAEVLDSRVSKMGTS